ncbi:MAG: 30S ribosomal protein S16 [Fimbriimonadales bacterium]
MKEKTHLVRIRLRRMGTKARPFYRIVAAPSSAGRDGRFVEQLGHYDPLKEPSLINIKKDRVLHWLNNGASPSDTLIRLLKKEGIWSEFEEAQPAGKPKRKPVKERVRNEKPVKEKKRKPVAAAAVEEPVAEAAVAEEPVIEKTSIAEAVESSGEAPVEEPNTAEVEAPVEPVAEEAAVEEASEPEAEKTEE